MLQLQTDAGSGLNTDPAINTAGALIPALTFQRECEQQPAALCSSTTHLHVFLLCLMPVALLATWTPSLASPSSPLSVTLQSALKLSQWCACVSSSRMTLKGQIVHVPLFICPQGTGVLTCLSCKQRKLYIPVKEKKKCVVIHCACLSD